MIPIGSPAFTFGFPTLYTPLAEEHLPVDKRAARFDVWVSAYHSHNPEALVTHDSSLLEDVPLPYPTPPISAFVSAGQRPPSVLTMSASDRAEISWPAAFNSSERHLVSMPPEITLAHTRRALFCDRAEGGRLPLPGCKFAFLWGAHGGAIAVAAAWQVEKLYKEHEAAAGTDSCRPTAVVGLSWANQFVSVLTTWTVPVPSKLMRWM